MLLKFHFKKEFIYFIYFIPFCLLKITFQKGLKNKKLLLSTESFSKILLIIFYFYQIIRYRKENKELLNKNKMNQRKIIFILLSIIYYIIYLFLENNYLNILYEDIHLDNLSILLVDLIFFKKQIYSHHILSIILTIISFSILFITYDLYKSLNIFFIFILKNYCESFSILLIKYINTIYFTNIYLLGNLIGLFSFLFQFFFYKINDSIKLRIVLFVKKIINNSEI